MNIFNQTVFSGHLTKLQTCAEKFALLVTRLLLFDSTWTACTNNEGIKVQLPLPGCLLKGWMFVSDLGVNSDKFISHSGSAHTQRARVVWGEGLAACTGGRNQLWILIWDILDVCLSIKSRGGWVLGDFSPHSETMVTMHRVSTLTGEKGRQRGGRAVPRVASGLQTSL